MKSICRGYCLYSLLPTPSHVRTHMQTHVKLPACSFWNHRFVFPIITHCLGATARIEWLELITDVLKIAAGRKGIKFSSVLLSVSFGLSFLSGFWVPSLDKLVLSYWSGDIVYTVVFLSITHTLTHSHMRTHMQTDMQVHLHALFEIIDSSSESLHIVYVLRGELNSID